MTRLLRTPVGLSLLGSLLLAGWALWTGGLFDSHLAAQARTNSIALDPGVEVDQPAAERILGNRKLIVAFRSPEGDLRDGCKELHSAADGNVVLLLRDDGEGGLDTYGCALIPGYDDDNFGKSAVAESIISQGVQAHADDPLTALKVIAVNYDLLVKAGTIPDGARTIDPPLPRYVIAGAALAATLAGTGLAYYAARRAGRLAARHRDERDRDTDARTALSARAAVLAGHIIDLDGRAAKHGQRKVKAYRALAADYAALAVDIAEADAEGRLDPTLSNRVNELTNRAQSLDRKL